MNNSARAARGFTLVELVVAVAIASVVVVFTAMFITAPLGAFAAQERRVGLVESAADTWPRLENDLRSALPNSVRATRNGNFVALEMLEVVAQARYIGPTNAPFTAAGTDNNVFRGVPIGFDSTTFYLSVNNLGTAGANAWALNGSITPAGARIQIGPGAIVSEAQVTVTPAAAFSGDSPRRTVYLVRGPVTWLCDETAGTMRRYAGYGIAVSQSSWDSTADFAAAGVPGLLVARGLTGCNFAVSAVGQSRSQTVAAILTTRDANSGDTVRLLHTMRAELLP